MKSFSTAARRGTAAVNNPVDIEFTIDDDTLVARPPTTGQMVLFMAAQDGGLETIQAMFDFLGSVLEDDGVDILRDKLRDGMDISVVTDIITYLIEEWSARPTSSSSDSSPSRASTGRQSTAKPRKRASTR